MKYENGHLIQDKDFHERLADTVRQIIFNSKNNIDCSNMNSENFKRTLQGISRSIDSDTKAQPDRNSEKRNEDHCQTEIVASIRELVERLAPPPISEPNENSQRSLMRAFSIIRDRDAIRTIIIHIIDELQLSDTDHAPCARKNATKLVSDNMTISPKP